MALRLKRPALWLVPLACALAAVIILPPRRADEFFTPSYSLGEVLLEMIGVGRGATFYSTSNWSRFDYNLSRVGRSLDERIARLAYEDTVRAMLSSPRSRRSATEPVVIAWTPAIPAESAAAWLRLAERELALYPRDPNHAGTTIAVLLVDRPLHGTQNNLRRLLLNNGASPQCVVTLPVTGVDREHRKDLVRERNGETRGSFIDWCGLFARFGTPGVSRHDLFGSTRGSAQATSWFTDVLSGRSGRGSFRGYNFSARACRAGSEVDCLHVASRGDDWDWRGQAPFLGYLLRRDPAAFGVFWRSTRPGWAALEEGFGISAGEISREWILQQNFDVTVTGPLPSFSQIGLAGLWVSLCVLIGAAVMTRKREGKKPWTFSLSGSPQ